MEKSKFPFHPVPPERQQVPPVFFPGRPIPGMAQAPPGYCGAAGARTPGGGAPQAAAQGTGPGCADQNPGSSGNADPSGCAKGTAAAAAVQTVERRKSPLFPLDRGGKILYHIYAVKPQDFTNAGEVGE